MNISDVPSSRGIAYTAMDLIGDTPMLELAKTGTGSRLILKLEQFNPTGSCKVRMAREMIMAAESEGKLRKGGHIVEPTSGNTGAGLALVAIERGYHFTAIVDAHAAPDKLRMMRALGAEIVVVEGTGSAPSTVERRRVAAELAAKTGAFWPDQHHNPNNNRGYTRLADELLRDLDEGPDYLVGAVGTGGTLCGTLRQLRNRGCEVFGIGVEPKGSIIFGGPAGTYWQSGAGAPDGFQVGPNVEHDMIDEGVTVGDTQAFATARVVARRSGLLLGGTAGAAIHVALHRLALVPPGSVLVVLVCDAGEKYLSGFFDDDWLRARSLLHDAEHHQIRRLFEAYRDSLTLAGRYTTFQRVAV